MLAIDTDLVNIDGVTAWTPPDAASVGPLSRGDSEDPRYFPTGVWGDPTLASKAKGRRLLAAMLEDLIDEIEGLRD